MRAPNCNEKAFIIEQLARNHDTPLAVFETTVSWPKRGEVSV
jgi:hypothetical protein